MFGVDLQQVLLLQAGHSMVGPASSDRVGSSGTRRPPDRCGSMPMEAGANSSAMAGPLQRPLLPPPPTTSPFVAMAQAMSAAKSALKAVGNQQVVDRPRSPAQGCVP